MTPQIGTCSEQPRPIDPCWPALARKHGASETEFRNGGMEEWDLDGRKQLQCRVQDVFRVYVNTCKHVNICVRIYTIIYIYVISNIWYIIYIYAHVSHHAEFLVSQVHPHVSVRSQPYARRFASWPLISYGGQCMCTSVPRWIALKILTSNWNYINFW